MKKTVIAALENAVMSGRQYMVLSLDWSFRWHSVDHLISLSFSCQCGSVQMCQISQIRNFSLELSIVN